MRLFLLTVLTMLSFASNSVLNRAAVGDGAISAEAFGTIRLWSGAVVLMALALFLGKGQRLRAPGRIPGVFGLLLYIYGFSAAYVALDSGLGALILFGCVQITMFVGSLLAGERPPVQRWVGAALAFGGLIWLLWPGDGPSASLWHGVVMALAGFGWGIYSLAGRRGGHPLASTAANFVIAAPIGMLLGAVVLPGIDHATLTVSGVVLAVVSGAVTSGLGYALWYSVLPRLAVSVAAVAQLTVPIIAMLGGMLFLGEALTPRFVIAATVVLGGVALSLVPLRRPLTRSR